ncbi:MAG: glycosyltransferase [Bacteroidales bacterium]|nr:glycosyltransferase [Bacteroidales bacterium]
MKVLITNIWLHSYGGTEVYVRDLACALHKHGFHVEVYSPVLGPIAKEIRDEGVHVVDAVEELKEQPDIIHAQHFIPAMEVISVFPDVPVVYFLHDRTHLVDTPPKYSRILKYVAVDYNCLDRLIIDNQIEKEDTEVLFNWVDTSRFKLRNHFSDKPLKALVFSNYATKDNYFQLVREACAEKGIELDGIGIGLKNAIHKPENLLINYDIVFAKAKAAMEALATGAAVVLCDTHGLGGMVTVENIGHFRKYNFGMKTLSRPIDKASVIREIEKYDPVENKRAALEIRKKVAFELSFGQITALYQEVVEMGLQQITILGESDRKILDEYRHLKKILFQDKIEKSKEELCTTDGSREKDALLQQQEKTIRELKGVVRQIKSSRTYRIGYLLLSPLRFIRRLVNAVRKTAHED